MLKINVKATYVALLIVLAACMGCQKTDLPAGEAGKPGKTATARNYQNAIQTYLNDQKAANPVDPDHLIDNVLQSMDEGSVYEENFRNEKFRIVPIPVAGGQLVTTKARTDLGTPYQCLLVVEDANGTIRRADIALFYPRVANSGGSSENQATQSLPANFFQAFFENQVLLQDGTLQLISLGNVKEFEFDFLNGMAKEFRSWQGRAPMAPAEEICIDWYLVTTVYWPDGTTEVYEEYLYTQCYGGTGGGGGGAPPSPPAPEPKTVVVIAKGSRHAHGGYECWTLEVPFTLTGMYYPGNTANNYFTSGQGSSSSSSNPLPFFTFCSSNTSSWFFSILNNTWDVNFHNSNKTAACWYHFTLYYPYQNGATDVTSNWTHWQAQVVLH